MGGPGTVFFEEKITKTTWQSRLYIDGQNLDIPKPVIVSEVNPRLARENIIIEDNNGAWLHFDHLLLQNKVIAVPIFEVGWVYFLKIFDLI